MSLTLDRLSRLKASLDREHKSLLMEGRSRHDIKAYRPLHVFIIYAFVFVFLCAQHNSA